MSKRHKKHIQQQEEYIESIPLGSFHIPHYQHKDDPSLIHVFVEGYEDVAFWRGIFDDHEREGLKFEIAVPPREDLAKGKRVLLDMVEESDERKILCVDSDFDFLFDQSTEQSRMVNNSPYIFHTYAYATENFLCYPPSLHNVCVKSTKNDTRIFDFTVFLREYSRIIYPLFIWYALSAVRKSEKIFSLDDFRNSVRINYLEIDNNGEAPATLDWLHRQVSKRLHILERDKHEWVSDIIHFERKLVNRGLTRDNTTMFMQGHTLLDHVVMTILNSVCEKLRQISLDKITRGTKRGIALRNELSNYNNSLRNVREVLLDNEGYKECPQYKLLNADIERYINKLQI